MITERGTVSPTMKGTVVALILLAVSAVVLSQVPALAGLAAIFWFAGFLFLLTALVFAVANYRSQAKTRTSP